MNRQREKRKKMQLKSHRIAQYDKALDGLLAGTHSPQYVHDRWQKLKKVL
jgi:hypothetical protein